MEYCNNNSFLVILATNALQNFNEFCRILEFLDIGNKLKIIENIFNDLDIEKFKYIIDHKNKLITEEESQALHKSCYLYARYGCIKLLKLARQLTEPCPWDWRICCGAAENGHLDILQWLYTQDPPCPWNRWTCWLAAKHGHLHVLQWARSQNPPCPWNVIFANLVASFIKNTSI